MRPLRLELEGFSAFRDRVTLDFADADLFVFTGPTGSGKSSLIDAMTFALYGSVPRLDNRALVHPVITQGRNEARVRFDFSAAGRDYTAVRVVRRTKDGATTREARLECEGSVLAGSADELTQQVETLLGLPFDQFTTCVVLPQGEFARFLHDKPTERQKLLARLLRLDEYRRMRELAVAREAGARERASHLTGQLATLVTADPDSETRARERLAELEALRAALDSAIPALDALASEERDAAERAAALEGDAARLGTLRVPADVERSGQLARAASEVHAATSRALEAAEQKLEADREARRALGELQPLEAAVRAHVERAEEAKRVEALARKLSAARRESERKAEALELAETALVAAREARDAGRDEHAAHALAGKLLVGKPCPVCARKVERRPKHEAPPALGKLERAVERAEAAARDATAAHRAAAEELAAEKRAAAEAETRLRAIDRALRGAPKVEELEQQLAAIAAAEARVKKSEAACEEARHGERGARQALEAARLADEAAWRPFEAARDPVAALGAPPADRSSLAASWKALVAWAAELAETRRTAAAEARAKSAAAGARRAEAQAALREACARAGVIVNEDAPPREAALEALASARAALARFEKDRALAVRLRTEQERATKEAAVAASLARHLRSDGFERWLLSDAVERLVRDASTLLRELSAGQYSFAVDRAGQFEVLDHRNADERRSARTLSGGETFLASLALALTLVEQLSELAEGSAKLESVFLDEGFGTLDPEALDLVASTIEELGSRGRAVGIVTHVRELAERIPVQYRVSRGTATSTVERVLLG